MKRLAVLALLVAAFGALMHFWPSDNPYSPDPSANAPSGEPRAGPTMPATAPPPSTPQARASAQPGAPSSAARTAAAPARIDIRAPRNVRSGETFTVSIDVQAPAGIRQLAFSVTYKKSILRLVRWTAGRFGEQGGASVQFEDVSEGSLLIRVDSGVVAGAGSIAVLEFEATARGESPLAIQDVTYVEDSRNAPVNRATVYEGSITVE
jgi:general secretion pathway protein D